jgi:transposase
MSELSNAKKKQLAEQLYVYDDLSQKEIAEYLGTTQKTISDWKTKGKWDEMKSAQTLTRDEIIKNLYHQALKIQEVVKGEDRMMTPAEVDMIMKISASIEKLDKKINLQVIIPVFKEFGKWLVEINPELAKSILPYQKQFIYLKAGE